MSETKNKMLSVLISDNNIELLEILSRRTRRTKDDLIEESLSYLFAEYKEAILDT